MKYKDIYDTIAGKTIDRSADQAKADEGKPSQIWVGRMVPTGSHGK